MYNCLLFENGVKSWRKFTYEHLKKRYEDSFVSLLLQNKIFFRRSCQVSFLSSYVKSKKFSAFKSSPLCAKMPCLTATFFSNTFNLSRNNNFVTQEQVRYNTAKYPASPPSERNSCASLSRKCGERRDGLCLCSRPPLSDEV